MAPMSGRLGSVRRFVLRPVLIATSALLLLAPAAHASGAGLAPQEVRRAPIPTVASVAVHRALAMRGVPYVWGGSTPGGFDCSGLVRYAYRAAGITLAHSSYAQWDAGRRVHRRDLRPGDIVFFGLGHVGIYLGSGRFVHAPETGRVVSINRIDRGWYAGMFSGGVRVHGSQQLATR
jgi:cell wall-associated NlpC family hydrolase